MQIKASEKEMRLHLIYDMQLMKMQLSWFQEKNPVPWFDIKMSYQ